MTRAPLILASTSRYRRDLLARLRCPFECHKPLIDEEALKGAHVGKAPKELAETLALAKAQDVSHRHTAAWVIGSDQLLSLNSAILGKQSNFEGACQQLERLSGREHVLITSVALCREGKPVEVWTDETRIRFRKLTRPEIEDYVRIEEPYDCAGSYKFESYGINLIEELHTQDPNAIVGLPLIRLRRSLAQKGYFVDA